MIILAISLLVKLRNLTPTNICKMAFRDRVRRICDIEFFIAQIRAKERLSASWATNGYDYVSTDD